ncbi:MAG: serine/threonine protein kinase [Polyangiaceae bacterium]|nr:serine/threonine protein kinase [Polyangiaceae bacterium]
MAGLERGRAPEFVGRYAICDELAQGGMATVHVGRLLGAVGFSRTVAIKRLHAPFAKDPEFVAMFIDEARLAARVRHPNVVSIIDVVAMQGELFLVMDYVHGESVAKLIRAETKQGRRINPRVAAKVASDILAGLHAAHEATNERGEPLGIVHRDVSPQNVLIGTDGIARVIDFGVAKAAGRLQHSQGGRLKGKLAYMAPEQVAGLDVDRRADVHASAAVLWELLTGRRLVERATEQTMRRFFQSARPRPEKALLPASARDVGKWVEGVAGELLDVRARLVAEVEMSSCLSDALPAALPEHANRGDSGGSPRATTEAESLPKHQPEAQDADASSATERESQQDSSVTAWAAHARKRRVRLWLAVVGASTTLAIVAFAVALADTGRDERSVESPADTPLALQTAPAVESGAPQSPPPSVAVSASSSVNASLASVNAAPASASSPASSAVSIKRNRPGKMANDKAKSSNTPPKTKGRNVWDRDKHEYGF